MRDYIYIWNDPVNQFIVASGIEFNDIAQHLAIQSGIILLNPSYFLPDYVKRDRKTSLSYILNEDINKLYEENVYSWGNFCWVDYTDDLLEITDQEIAELLYIEHMGKPMNRIVLPSLRNRFLYLSHDDGWYLKLYYTSWDDIAALTTALCPLLNLIDLQSDGTAFWVSNGMIEKEERTFDIDAVLNRRFPHPRRKYKSTKR